MRPAVSPLALKQPDLRGLTALVIGLGRSGLAAARLLAGRGCHIVAADARSEEALGAVTRELRAQGAELATGGHPAELADRADLVIASPGVPLDVPVISAAKARGLPVWSEIELAWRFCLGRVVGITGTNGKSTTTAMIGAILRAAGIPGGTGGNLGTPFCELLDSDANDAVHAVELSSFQLEAVEGFRAAVGVVLNLTPDHQDRYPSVDAYALAKARLLDTQAPPDAALLNADDPEAARFLPHVRGRLHRFSTRGEVDAGAFVRRGTIVLRTDAGEERLMDAAALPVPGEHNLANALAAAAACRLAGAPAEAIGRALAAYRALPHRLELVDTFRGVAFYNDSKATNLDAAERAVRSFAPGRIHLILGGKDKGADWASVAPLLRERARRVLLVGQAAPTIRAALSGAVEMLDCGTVSAAVASALDGASDGDVVLLAPGCASFDQYRDFEERGEDFRRAVLALRGSGGSNA